MLIKKTTMKRIYIKNLHHLPSSGGGPSGGGTGGASGGSSIARWLAPNLPSLEAANGLNTTSV